MTTGTDIESLLATLGAFFLLGLIADLVGRATPVPRVTVLILAGALIGDAGLGLVPEGIKALYEVLAAAALGIVAFVLGGGLTRKRLLRDGRMILLVSLAVACVSAAVVGGGLLLAGLPALLALPLAAIATATDPAATADVVRQSGRKGRFANTLLAVTAVDDAWGLILFSLALATLSALEGAAAAGILQTGARELLGAVALGLAFGLPAAALTGRIRAGEPLLTEMLGVVFLCTAAARWLEVSFLLAVMVAGATVSNLATHHTRPFHAILRVEWPFLVLFFILAGATVDPRLAAGAAGLAVVFVALRVAGRLLGGVAAARLAGLGPREGRWTGLALLPQAGVAVGMALVAGEHLPEHRETLLAVTVAATVVFEVVGPILTRIALDRVAAEDEAG